MNLSISSRLEKQRKKLHKEYLLKDLKDDKEEKLEKVWCFSMTMHIMIVEIVTSKMQHQKVLWFIFIKWVKICIWLNKIINKWCTLLSCLCILSYVQLIWFLTQWTFPQHNFLLHSKFEVFFILYFNYFQFVLVLILSNAIPALEILPHVHVLDLIHFKLSFSKVHGKYIRCLDGWMLMFSNYHDISPRQNRQSLQITTQAHQMSQLLISIVI